MGVTGGVKSRRLSRHAQCRLQQHNGPAGGSPAQQMPLLEGRPVRHGCLSCSGTAAWALRTIRCGSVDMLQTSELKLLV